LATVYQMVAGGFNAYAGRTDAFAGSSGGELVVIGDIYTNNNLYLAHAGNMWAGNAKSVAGYFEVSLSEKIIFPIPTDQNSWPFVFFVGGNATRDGITGVLTAIERVNIANERRAELLRIILKFKPMFTWCGLLVNYI